MCLLGQASYAQFEVKGRVADLETEEPLIGVSVYYDSLGQKSGVMTDLYGNFTIQVPNREILLHFVMMGYDNKEMRSKNSSLVLMKASSIGLQEVLVTGNRDERRRDELPMAISKIGSDDIDKFKPNSLDQVLNTIPGVHMVDLGNEQHMMSIRQPISTKSLFLYLEDGLPIRPTGNFNHNAMLEMDMAMMDRIEVVRGPASSIYGSEAIGGAINLITTKPTHSPEARFGVRISDQGYARTDFKATGTQGRLGVAIGGYLARQKDGYREYSDMEKNAITANLTYALSNKTDVSAGMTWVDYRADMAGSIDSAGFFANEFKSLHRFTERDVNALRVKTRVDHRWSESGKTSFTFQYRNNTTDQIPSYRLSPRHNNGEINSNSFSSYVGLIQHTQEFNLLQGAILTGGVSFDNSPMAYEAYLIKVNKSEDGIFESYEETDSLLTDYEVDVRNMAAYTNFELKFTSRLQVSLGLRLDRFVYDYRNFLSKESFSGAPNSKDVFRSFSPRVGVIYNFTNDFGMFGNYSRGFVPPSVGELYRGVKVPELKPAKFDNFELGGWRSFLSNKLILDFAMYAMIGHDEIISVRLEDDSFINRNAGKTLHYGLEYSVKYKPVEQLALRASGSNSVHRYMEYVEKGNDFGWNEMPGAPSWIFNAGIDYRPVIVKGLKFSFEWQRVSSYFMDQENSEEYEGYNLLNARASYTFKFVEVWGNIMNITDELYATRASLSYGRKQYTPGLPRTFQVGLNINVGKRKRL